MHMHSLTNVRVSSEEGLEGTSLEPAGQQLGRGITEEAA